MPGRERPPIRRIPVPQPDTVPDPAIIDRIRRDEERKRDDKRPHVPEPIHPDDIPYDPDKDDAWRKERDLPPLPRDKRREYPEDFPTEEIIPDDPTADTEVNYKL